MDVSSAAKARQDLAEIQATTTKMRANLAYGGVDTILMVWGVVWFVGFVTTDMYARGVVPSGVMLSAGAVWLALVGLGVAFTVYWGIRYSRHLPQTGGPKVGWFWLLLYAYVWLAYAILMPMIDLEAFSTADGARRYAALATLVPMFAYVVMGLFIERYFLWIGLSVTALLFLGLFGVPHFFWLWMAFWGGGALFVPGLIMRRYNVRRLTALGDEEVSHA